MPYGLRKKGTVMSPQTPHIKKHHTKQTACDKTITKRVTISYLQIYNGYL